MIKMIVSDMDGTLLKNHLEITPYTKSVLQQAKDEGITIVYATGRPYQTMKQFISESPYLDYVALNNGNEIYSVKKNEILFQNPLDKTEVERVISYATTNGLDVELHLHDSIIYNGKSREGFFQERNNLAEEQFKAVLKPIGEVNQEELEQVLKIMFVIEDLEHIQSHRRELEKLGHYDVVQSEATYIDIVPKGISKGRAVEKIATIEQISLEHIAAFGDQENDISMLEIVGESYAMANAFPKTIEVAKYVAEVSEADGVAKAILKYLK